MLHLDIFSTGILQRFALEGMDLKHSVGSSRRVSTQVSRVDNDGAVQDRASKAGELGWRNQDIGLARHFPLFHALQIQVHRERRWIERIITSLLEHVLSKAAQTRARFQVGIGLVSTHVKQHIRRCNTNDQLIDLERARIGNAVHTARALPASSSRFNVMEAQRTRFNAFCPGNADILARLHTISKGRLRIAVRQRQW